MAKIFELWGSIFIDADEANKSLQKTDSKMKNVGKQLGSGIKTAAKWSGAFVGAAAAVGAGMLKAGSEFAETTDRIDKMSQKIGLSRQSFQELDFITSQTGTNIEVLQGGVKKLTDAADEAAKGNKLYGESFDKLGISVKKSDGTLKSQEDLLFETINALQSVENETERAALANDLLGKSATELAPLLNAGAGEMEALREKANEMGLVLGDDAIDAGVKFTDTMDQVKRTLKALATTFFGEIMPVLQLFLDFILENIPMIREIFGNVFGAVGESVQRIFPFLMHLIEQILPPLIEIITMIAEEILPPLLDAFIELAEHVLPIVIDVFESLMPIIEPIMNTFVSIIQTAVALIKGDWDGVFNGLKATLENATNAILAIIEPFAEAFEGIFQGIADTIGGIWDGLIGTIQAGVDFMKDKINDLIKKVNSFKVPSWVPGIGGKSPDIPELADGGDIRTSGAIIVGENGPEIFEAQAGARVTPLPDTGPTDTGMRRGGDVNQEINIYANTPLTPAEVGKQTKRASRALALELIGG